MSDKFNPSVVTIAAVGALALGALGGLTLAQRAPTADPTMVQLVRLREAIQTGVTMDGLRQMTVNLRTEMQLSGRSDPALVQALQDTLTIWRETIEGYRCQEILNLQGCVTRVSVEAERLGVLENARQLPPLSGVRELRGLALTGLGIKVDAAIAARGSRRTP